MAFKPYKPSVGSKGEEKAAERAFMSRKPVAKPTVKAVRDESRVSKAALVTSKATGKPGESRMSQAEAARGAAVASKATTSPKYRGGLEGDGKMVGRQSSGPVSRGVGTPKAAAPAKSYANRQGGMDSQVYKKPQAAKPQASTSTNSSFFTPAKEFTPASKKILADARAEITPVVTALAGGRLLYKGGKKILDIAVKAYKGPAKYTPYRLKHNTKPQKVDADDVGRPIEELFKKGKGTPTPKPQATKPQRYSETDPNYPLPPGYRPPAPKPYPSTSSKYVPKKVKFPKAVKGRKLTGTGTYTQFGN